MSRYPCLLLLWLTLSGSVGGADQHLEIARIYPLGGQRGTSVSLEILSQKKVRYSTRAAGGLSNPVRVEFDCLDLVWKQTLEASRGRLLGTVEIAPAAALGPHLLRVLTREGYSTSALFNVGQFSDLVEAEPDDTWEQAQAATDLPRTVQGRLDGAADIDFFAIQVKAAQRWTFDFRSIDFGSAVESKMSLLDQFGDEVAFNDDRSFYDETPFLEKTFETGGTYYVKLDQYRGARGFNFGKNCSYMLRMTSLPTLNHLAPLALAAGRTSRITLAGAALEGTEKVYLTRLRGAEHARMTYPFTVPTRFENDPASARDIDRIEGKVVHTRPESVEVEFAVPDGAPRGLWRVWVDGPGGIVDGPSLEVSGWTEYAEGQADSADWRQGPYGVHGRLERPGELDIYEIEAEAGQPLHLWTLAAQLGVPDLDTVLVLRDASGKKLAESDDVVAGQGTLIGNPDSSLFYTPEQGGRLLLTVKDRLSRGGPEYVYRLKVKSEKPSFQLFTTPENVSVARGDSVQIKVHLVRETGFQGEVSIWFESLPGSVEPNRGKFRADQLFEPNADGADMIIPEIPFRIHIPESQPLGTHAFEVRGVPTSEEARQDRRMVKAETTLIMGPLLDAWNYTRRPLPETSLTIVEPLEGYLSVSKQHGGGRLGPALNLAQGGTATLSVQAENIPKGAPITVKDLPSGVIVDSESRENTQIRLILKADSETPLGTFEISAEARVRDRWIYTEAIDLKVVSGNKIRAGR